MDGYMQAGDLWFGSRDGKHASLGGGVLVTEGDGALAPDEARPVWWGAAPNQVRNRLDPMMVPGVDPEQSIRRIFDRWRDMPLDPTGLSPVSQARQAVDAARQVAEEWHALDAAAEAVSGAVADDEELPIGTVDRMHRRLDMADGARLYGTLIVSKAADRVREASAAARRAILAGRDRYPWAADAIPALLAADTLAAPFPAEIIRNNRRLAARTVDATQQALSVVLVAIAALDPSEDSDAVLDRVREEA